MRILRGTIVTGLVGGLVGLLAACGATGGTGDGDRRASDPKKVDREQFEAVRAEVEKIRTDAFAAAGRAVEGEARPGKIILVPCELKGEGVGQLVLRGSLLYNDLDGAASAAAVRKAWDDLGLVSETDPDDSVGWSTTVSGVRITLAAGEPIAVQQGPNAVLRRLDAGSACMDLGPELYDEIKMR